MREIDPEEIAKKYNAIDIIWDEKDKWHQWTKKWIKKFIWKSLKKIPDYGTLKILNAGSAGYSYELNEANVTHIDIAKDKISHLSNSIVGSAEKIPSKDKQFGIIICVGTVINYCDPIRVFEEFSRVLISGGYVILEFENSYTFELLGKESFNKKATLVKTFYQGHEEKIWYFSESYIKELAINFNFEIISRNRCHTISPFIYRITNSEKIAAWFGKLDIICSFIPGVRRFSSNSILLLRLRNEN